MLLLKENTYFASTDPGSDQPHVAANNDGVCWSFADARTHTPVPLPLAAFRRASSWAVSSGAASSGVATAPSDGLGTRISRDALMTIAQRQIARGASRPSQARPPLGKVTFPDRRTLRTSTHYVTVHPYDAPAKQRTRDEFRRNLQELRDGQPLGEPELTRRWQLLSDARFGAFAELDDATPRQLPLKVTMVKAAGLELTLRDITGPIGVPVVACASPAGETVYGSGAKLAEAVTQALTAALFRYQTQTDPVLKSATSMAPPAIWVNPASAESLSPDRLVSALTGLGYLPSVFGLDHDPAVSAAFPYVLRSRWWRCQARRGARACRCRAGRPGRPAANPARPTRSRRPRPHWAPGSLR